MIQVQVQVGNSGVVRGSSSSIGEDRMRSVGSYQTRVIDGDLDISSLDLRLIIIISSIACPSDRAIHVAPTCSMVDRQQHMSACGHSR